MNQSTSYKLTTPSTAGQVLRVLQLQQIESAFQRVPVVWVVGLPGAGKTSLAGQYLESLRQRDHQVLWYRIDEDDTDGAVLFDSLGRSVAEQAQLHLPVWSPENQSQLASFSRRYFATVVSAGNTCVVLDDCHRLDDTSAVFDIVVAAREAGPMGLRMLLLSRNPPPPALARGIAGGWLAVIDDMKVTQEEACEIAERAVGRPLSPVQIERLQEARGWVAHVLALAHGPADPMTQRIPAEVSQSSLVGDYLATELLKGLKPPQRAAFRQLAELPEIPFALASSERIAPDVLRLLEHLATRRYFVDANENAWRLHDILRDALRQTNTASETPHSLAAVRRELAEWVGPHAPEVSMQLLCAAHDLDGAARWLRQYGQQWMERGRQQQVLGWLDGLDLPAIEPVAPGARQQSTCLDSNVVTELLLWRAEAMLPTQPERARPIFAQTRQRFALQGLAAPAYRAWCGEVESYVVQWGAVAGLAELVDDLEALTQTLGPPSDEWAFRTSANALTALMYGRAEDPRLPRYARETALAIEHAAQPDQRIAAASQLLIYKMWWAGDFPAGRALYNTFDAEVREGEHLAPLARLLWWSCASIVDWQCGKPDECYRKVERGLALAASSGVHVRDFFLLTQGIFCALSEEDWPRAEAYLEQLARTERTQKRLDVMVHHFFRSWYSLSRGDAPTALAHAESAWTIAQAMGSTFHKVIALSALGPARVHVGDLAGAEETYRQQMALAKGSQNPTFAFIGFCAGAEIALAQDDLERTKRQVERMLTVKHLGGFQGTCGWRAAMMEKVFACALTHGIQPEVARTWIREKRMPRPEHYVGLDWPMSVQIRALDGLEVEVDGVEDASEYSGDPASRLANKPAKRLREILALLIAEPAGLTQASLCDWLWPDAEGDKASATLKVTVHRLRTWLGADSVLMQQGRIRLNPARVACDLWELLHAPTAVVKRPDRVLAGFDLPPVVALRRRLSR